MVIKKLHMHNFGVYAGDNEFVFNSHKPVVLIGGMNGRGKTTFLEAVLLALYGSNSFAYTESGRKSYSQYLRSFINRNADDNICKVELEFEINNTIKENYVVRREWDALNKRTREHIYVYKDGMFNEFLTANWPMFVENILPSALSSFFFFDGKKIAELAVDSTNIQLKNSIRSMLGISVLDVLSSDILRNLKRITRAEKGKKTEDVIDQLREEKEASIKYVRDIELELEKMHQILLEDQDSLEILRQSYTVKGGNAVEKQLEIESQKSALEKERDGENERLFELMADLLPLVLVNDLIVDVKLQATDEHQDMIMQEAVCQLDDFLDDFKAEYNGSQKSSIDFVEYVKRRIKENQKEQIYGLSELALFQTNNLVEGVLKNVVSEARVILERKIKISEQISDLQSYLTLDINENELEDIQNKIRTMENQIIDDKIKIADLEQRYSEAVSKMNSATSELNKQVETYLSIAELKDKADRTKRYSNIALKIIERYEIELQKRKIDVLAETITNCYTKLANKKNLIKTIVMDPETLDLKYLSEEGIEIPKDSLSAGEQQLMVISILWALAICSKKKLPVIIDTPLSRLDSLHRTALITTYFPNAGEQTIILSTDSEIDENYYELMRENVGDEFTLKYDEDSKSTSIERGYLIGAKL